MSRRAHETAPVVGASAECEAFAVDDAAVARVLAAQPDDGTTSAAAAIFDALSDATRLRLVLALLTAGELCVCDLACVAGVSPSAVSHQLRLLRDRGLVGFRRDGKRAVYRLADEHVSALLSEGLDHAREIHPPGGGK